MNFFQAQQHARSSTRRLVFLFILAIIALIVSTDLLVLGFMGYLDNVNTLDLAAWQQEFDWKIFAGVSCSVIAVVTLASFYKMLQLRKGGAAIANIMGATLVPANTQDFHQKRLLNVVEEMAIASGTPMPPVYLMQDEQAINAFAAGHKPGDAIITVTHGTLHKLSRSELQGVIAHEFSHILNGDMGLNIRLISILHGILVIGIIGYYLMRVSGGRSSHSSNNKDSGGLVFLGLGLLIIGYAGTFFGNLIKASVSRKREFLADASAVQFTRDSSGIANALKSIGADQTGSVLTSPRASEYSHAYFSQGVVTFFDSLMATHPPLAKRIKAIEPSWDGDFKQKITVSQQSKINIDKPKVSPHKPIIAAVAVAQAITEIGQITPEHVKQAEQILHKLPKIILESAHEPHGARAIIYLLVLDKIPQQRAEQLQYLEQHADADVHKEVKKLINYETAIDVQNRLALVDITLSSLRQLSKPQYQLFSTNLQALIEMDKRIELFEWALQKIVFHHLDPVFMGQAQGSKKFISRQEQKVTCQVLFSLLLLFNKQQHTDVQQVFTQAMEQLGFSKQSILKKSELSLYRLNKSVDLLANLRPLEKPLILKACAYCITADNVIQPLEAELFRAIAAILDCPMPPLAVAE